MKQADEYNSWRIAVGWNYDAALPCRATANKIGFAELWTVGQTEAEAVEKIKQLIDRTERAGS